MYCNNKLINSFKRCPINIDYSIIYNIDIDWIVKSIYAYHDLYFILIKEINKRM